jgi:hypothetical protein
VVISLVVGAVFVAAAAYALYLIHVGLLDAAALAEKVAVPRPTSALDWPEMHVSSVLAEPDDGHQLLVSVVWPARPTHHSILLFEVSDQERDLQRLAEWSSVQASVTAVRLVGNGVELRQRQGLQRVYASLLAERSVPAG